MMAKVNSQSQSGSASFGFPEVNGLPPNTLASRRNEQNNINEGILQPVDNEAFTKRAEVDVRASRGSNAQGQSQITQADVADIDQIIVPIGVQEETPIIG